VGAKSRAVREPRGQRRKRKRGPLRRLAGWWANESTSVKLLSAVLVSVLTAGAVPGVTWIGRQVRGNNPALAAPSDPAYQEYLPGLGVDCGPDWIVPDPVDQAIFDAEAAPTGSAMVSGGKVGIVLQGDAERVIILHRLRAKVVERSAPVTGFGRVAGEPCGGQVLTSYLKMDFDDAAPLAVPRPKVADNKQFPFTLKEDDPIQLDVDLSVTNNSVQFVLLLDWTWMDQQHTMTIDNDGKPFVLSSPEAAPTICNDNGTIRTLPPETAC
jgi:hypothetical protein